MTHLVVAIVGALVGIWIDRWWQNYIAECDDLRTIEQRRRARTACTYNPRRWE